MGGRAYPTILYLYSIGRRSHALISDAFYSACYQSLAEAASFSYECNWSAHNQENTLALSKKNILCLLAHQDDEYFIAPFLIREQKEGNIVTCVYITDGSGYGINPEIRNRESLSALSSIGIRKRNIIFLGGDFRFRDSEISSRCQDVLDALHDYFRSSSFDKIYCPAWEGGHVDHDAVHLIALAFASTQEPTITAWEFSLYHAYRMPRGLFRVMSLLKSPTTRNTEKLSFVMAVKWAFLFKYYRSQWRTWLGLFPEAITKIILLRSAHIQATSVSRIFNRPHQGSLLYETKFGIAYEDFKKDTEQFQDRYFR